MWQRGSGVLPDVTMRCCTGKIPDGLSALLALEDLNLHQNKLHGKSHETQKNVRQVLNRSLLHAGQGLRSEQIALVFLRVDPGHGHSFCSA